MPEMSEKRHDPVGGNGNCSAQKLEHLREKSEQELLDELTQTMKWSDQEVDLDAIDAYLQVLEEKAPMPEQKKPEEALAAFKAKHALLLKKVSKKHTHGKTTPAPRQNNNHRISRGLVAAVLAAALSCTVIASASGIDIFKSIARWTKDVFHFSPAQFTETQSSPTSVTYATLSEALEENAVDPSVLPTWYPSEYQCTEVYCRILLDSTKIRAQYSNGESEYSITIHRFTTALKASQSFLEKDDGEFDVRNINGIDYYILSNVDNRNVTWTVDNLQVVISGDLSDEEINSMIDSINEG